MSSIGRKAFIAEQIQFLKKQIEETASILENLHRNGGVIPWETGACQKTTLQLLEEQLRDERQLLADWQGLLLPKVKEQNLWN